MTFRLQQATIDAAAAFTQFGNSRNVHEAFTLTWYGLHISAQIRKADQNYEIKTI